MNIQEEIEYHKRKIEALKIEELKARPQQIITKALTNHIIRNFQTHGSGYIVDISRETDTGMIGSNHTRRLKDSGYEIVALDWEQGANTIPTYIRLWINAIKS